MKIPNGSIVYADPPYNNTTGYSGGKFNSEEFWDYMREISQHNKVFISEQKAPDDFECIWEKPFTISCGKPTPLGVGWIALYFKNNSK